MSVPFVDLSIQHRAIADEVNAGFAAVLEKGDYIGGKAVSDFEQRYAEYIGVRECVGVGNGTDALELALRAIGVERDDEVIIPANTFIATAEAVARAGAKPVLADVDDDTLLIDPSAVARALTPRTRAVIPVHLYGQAAAVEEIRALIGNGVTLIEDAAQSQGARRHGRPAGSLGDIAGTSFYPGKNLGAYGDGGAVLTDSTELATQVRLLGAHGSRIKYQHEVLGFNSRLDTLQAVVLNAKLGRLDGWNAQRRAAADRYSQALTGIENIKTPVTSAGNEHVWHLYVVRVPNRDEVVARLQAKGVGASIHYPVPVHLTAAFADLGLGRGAFPVAERSGDEILSLPMYPGISASDQDQVVEALIAAVA